MSEARLRLLKFPLPGLHAKSAAAENFKLSCRLAILLLSLLMLLISAAAANSFTCCANSNS